nr:hypothetical protein Iba_chr05aCG3660 [Ipomoea batatas]
MDWFLGETSRSPTGFSREKPVTDWFLASRRETCLTGTGFSPRNHSSPKEMESDEDKAAVKRAVRTEKREREVREETGAVVRRRELDWSLVTVRRRPDEAALSKQSTEVRDLEKP